MKMMNATTKTTTNVLFSQTIYGVQMKKFFAILLFTFFLSGCSEIGIVREKVCENKEQIKSALDVLCGVNLSPRTQRELEDSLNVWLGLKSK